MAGNPNWKNVVTVALISVLAVGILATYSRWFRGLLQTGWKAQPAPETQVP